SIQEIGAAEVVETGFWSTRRDHIRAPNADIAKLSLFQLGEGRVQCCRMSLPPGISRQCAQAGVVRDWQARQITSRVSRARCPGDGGRLCPALRIGSQVLNFLGAGSWLSALGPQRRAN